MVRLEEEEAPGISLGLFSFVLVLKYQTTKSPTSKLTTLKFIPINKLASRIEYIEPVRLPIS
jgi:hypothetical protein